MWVAAASAMLLVGATHAGAPAASTPVRATGGPLTSGAACERLSGRSVGDVVLKTSVVAKAGILPTYCRVTGTIAPALNFEIRLPDAWNGKLYYGGGGGYDGAIPEPVAEPLAQGYVEVASDSGHQGDGMSAAFVLNDPQAAELFGSGAVPAVMATARQVVIATYGTPPARAYFEGCSTGGQQALMAVQRHPTLFDGVIARAPAFNWVGFMGAFHRTAQALGAPGGEFSAAKIALLARHVRSACDRLDGVVDGIVANPTACTARVVHVAALRCPGGVDAGDACLSDAQLAVVDSWTSDATFHGRATYVAKGYNLTGNEDAEMNFGIWASGNGDLKSAGQFVMEDTTVKYYLAHDPQADSLAYTPWDKDPAALDAMAALNDATNPDIRPFEKAGGKFILYGGWADEVVNPLGTSSYYDSAERVVGSRAETQSFFRTFMIPGESHIPGNVGAESINYLYALEDWVERGKAPDVLIGRKLKTITIMMGPIVLDKDLVPANWLYSRPHYPYPIQARYKGKGDPDDAASFAPWDPKTGTWVR